ncbi:PCNA domain-containing protein [Actinidia rufa]|uniref:PCNA domain-containing protein n=1 Tax=Actinidia rufa TaxID=165716 RepID=A0A7J0GXG0_9ERIC|nr:PCNA domain-containing protein [Actinidia rufa]
MSSSGVEPQAADLVCQDNVQGMVDALTSVRWKRHQDAVVELSEHGIVLIVEETRCLQAKVYLQRELFIRYEYSAQGRPRFGVCLGLFVDCLNTFSVPGHSSTIEIQYPGPDMQLLLKCGTHLFWPLTLLAPKLFSNDDFLSPQAESQGLLIRKNACIYAEIRTRIPERVSWDYNFEPAGSTPLSFTVRCLDLLSSCTDKMYAYLVVPKPKKLDVAVANVISAFLPRPMAYELQFKDAKKVVNNGEFTIFEVSTIDPSNIKVFNPQSAAFKEAIDDLEWPGSSIQITLQPVPPSVTFRGNGHGDSQIDFMYYVNTDLLVAFHCDHQVSYRYKYKFLRTMTSNIPASVIKDNRGSKLTIVRVGMLKVQHLLSVARTSISHSHIDSAGYQQPSRIAYIEFFVKPEGDEATGND